MLMTLLLDVMTDLRLNYIMIEVILCRHVLCGLLLDQYVPTGFLSSGLGRGSHVDLHVLRRKLLLD